MSRDVFSTYDRDDIVPFVENAKKIADVLDVSLEYLVSDEEKQMAIDDGMLQRIIEIQKCSDPERNVIVWVIDAFIWDTKAKQAFGLSH